MSEPEDGPGANVAAGRIARPSSTGRGGAASPDETTVIAETSAAVVAASARRIFIGGTPRSRTTGSGPVSPRPWEARRERVCRDLESGTQGGFPEGDLAWRQVPSGRIWGYERRTRRA